MRQLKELDQRCNIRGVRMFCRFINVHAFGSSKINQVLNAGNEEKNSLRKGGRDMPVSECLYHENKDLLNCVLNLMTVMTGVCCESFDSLQRLAVSMYEFKSNIEREEEVELMCCVRNVGMLGGF